MATKATKTNDEFFAYFAFDDRRRRRRGLPSLIFRSGLAAAIITFSISISGCGCCGAGFGMRVVKCSWFPLKCRICCKS
jgi:hypothetical protein